MRRSQELSTRLAVFVFNILHSYVIPHVVCIRIDIWYRRTVSLKKNIREQSTLMKKSIVKKDSFTRLTVNSPSRANWTNFSRWRSAKCSAIGPITVLTSSSTIKWQIWLIFDVLMYWMDTQPVWSKVRWMPSASVFFIPFRLSVTFRKCMNCAYMMNDVRSTFPEHASSANVCVCFSSIFKNIPEHSMSSALCCQRHMHSYSFHEYCNRTLVCSTSVCAAGTSKMELFHRQ